MTEFIWGTFTYILNKQSLQTVYDAESFILKVNKWLLIN